MAIAEKDVLQFVESRVIERTGRPLNDLQNTILKEVWIDRKKTYDEIASKHSYSNLYIKQVAGPELWKILSQVFHRKVSKTNFHSILQAQYSKYQPRVEADLIPTTPIVSTADHSLAAPFTQPLQCPEGPLPLDSPFYIQRFPQEEHLCCQMLRSGALLRIKGPSEIGKSSFLLRLLHQAQQQLFHTVTLNFRSIDREIIQDLSKLTRWTAATLSRKLGLIPKLDDYWDPDVGDKLSCTLYLEGYLLNHLKSPIVIAFEELQELFQDEFVAQEFLAMLRVWHENTRADPFWKQLHLVIVQTTESYISLNVNQSPLTIGHELKLEPFRFEQVQTLATLYQLSLPTKNLHRLSAAISAHPHLLQLAFYHLSQPNQTLDNILKLAATDESIFRRHLHRHLSALQNNAAVEQAFQQVLASSNPITLPRIPAFKLLSMGLVKPSGNQVSVSCELYQAYFSQRL